MHHWFGLFRYYGLGRKWLLGLIGVSFFFDLVAQGIEILIPLLSKLIFDHALPQSDLSLLLLGIVGYLLFEMTLIVVGNFSGWIDLLVSQYLVRNIQDSTLADIRGMAFTDFKKRSTGDFQANLESDALRVASYMAFWIPGTLLNGIKILVIAYLGYQASPWCLAVYVAMLPFYLFEFHTFTGFIAENERSALELQGRFIRSIQNWLEHQGLLRVTTEKVAGIGAITAVRDRQFQVARKAELLGRSANLSSSLGIFGLKLLVALGLGYGVIRKQITVGEFIALELLFTQAGPPVHALVERFRSARVTRVSLQRLGELGTARREGGEAGHDSSNLEKGATTVSASGLRILLDDGRDLFEPVTFEAGPGRSVALVGPSGVGKSTLTLVLLGLQSATQGTLRIGGIPIESWRLSSLRRLISWAPQLPLLPRITIREFITSQFEPARSSVSDERILLALERVGLADWLRRQPQGLNAELGLECTPSGGECQRLSLARVLYEDRPILILDEPTASLDSEIASLIKGLLREREATRTVIVVTHDEDWAQEFPVVCRLVDMQGRVSEMKENS